MRKKIIRDATMTTGAPWSSLAAGPNRIFRWVMLLSDEKLLALGVDMRALPPHVRDKLRQKAAGYEACMGVAVKLTASAYTMKHAPAAPKFVSSYLEACLGAKMARPARCQICRSPLDFADFSRARRGVAEIETSHASAREHTAANVDFAHRRCNIAQGEMALGDFWRWLRRVVRRLDRKL